MSRNKIKILYVNTVRQKQMASSPVCKCPGHCGTGVNAGGGGLFELLLQDNSKCRVPKPNFRECTKTVDDRQALPYSSVAALRSSGNTRTNSWQAFLHLPPFSPQTATFVVPDLQPWMNGISRGKKVSGGGRAPNTGQEKLGGKE